MKVVIFGSSGMVGQSVLREALALHVLGCAEPPEMIQGT